MRWRLHLEYDGRPFSGWQLQPNAPTVQGALEEALARLLGHPVRVHAAGRTDTGVHALEQIVCFETTTVRTAQKMRDGLNAMLPASVAVIAAEEAPEGFDPRHSPHTKTYRYTWLCRPARSPLRAGRCWHVRAPLDAAAMDRAVAAVVGTHDFSAFRAEGCTATHPIRTIASAAVREEGDEVVLAIRGTGFLRHSVRILAGSLYEVGRGKRPPAWIAEVLAGRDRTAAGRTAPAEGLLLAAIDYHAEAGVGGGSGGESAEEG